MKDALYENIDCDLCGSGNKKVLLEKEGLICPQVFKIAKCLKCGLIYVTPRLTRNSISGLYNQNYYGNSVTPAAQTYWDDSAARQKKSDYIFNIIKNSINLTADSRILDVGCGKGDFLESMKQSGYAAEGIELSTTVYNELKGRGLDIHIGDISQGVLAGCKYDVIVAADVIEHTYSPRQFLESVYALLNKGGIFLCLTDMADYFLNSEGAAWNQLTPDIHLYYFSRATFKRYFRECGFVERFRDINILKKFQPLKLWNKPLMRRIDR